MFVFRLWISDWCKWSLTCSCSYGTLTHEDREEDSLLSLAVLKLASVFIRWCTNSAPIGQLFSNVAIVASFLVIGSFIFIWFEILLRSWIEKKTSVCLWVLSISSSMFLVFWLNGWSSVSSDRQAVSAETSPLSLSIEGGREWRRSVTHNSGFALLSPPLSRLPPRPLRDRPA